MWLPDGLHWTKLNGHVLVIGNRQYWSDGDITENANDGTLFTSMPRQDREKEQEIRARHNLEQDI